MPKVRLDPETLKVQSFAVAAEPSGTFTIANPNDSRMGSCESACGLCHSIDYC